MSTIPQIAARLHKNEMHLAGNLAQNVDLRYTQTGKAVARFTVAVTHKELTEYVRVVAWEKLAEKVQPLTKGTFVQVVGKLQTRSWEDKRSREKKYSTEVSAWQIVIPDREVVTENVHGVSASDADIPF